MGLPPANPALVLHLLLLFHLQELPGVLACSCAPSHPQQDFCQSNVVMKAKLISSELIGREGEEWIRYQIQPRKVFKGSETMGSIQHVYSPANEILCGLVIQPDTLHQDYVLSGNVDTDGKVYVDLCGFNRPWKRVTHEQRVGLNGRYAKGCQCTIVPCVSIPCGLTSDQQCLWTDGVVNSDWTSGPLSRRFSCSLRRSGLCRWLLLAPRTPPGQIQPLETLSPRARFDSRLKREVDNAS